jgi:hypothetical protein
LRLAQDEEVLEFSRLALLARAALLDKKDQNEINKFMELYDTVYAQSILVEKSKRMLPDEEFKRKLEKMEKLKDLKLPVLPANKKANYKKINA